MARYGSMLHTSHDHSLMKLVATKTSEHLLFLPSVQQVTHTLQYRHYSSQPFLILYVIYAYNNDM